MIATLLLTVLGTLLWWVEQPPLPIADVVKPSDPASPIVPAPDSGQTATAPSPPVKMPANPPETLTDAERIARLQRSIEADEKALKTLERDGPTTEFRQAETEFKDLDVRLEELTREVQRLQGEGKEPEAAAAGLEREKLHKQWQLSKERFNLAIQERRTLQEKAKSMQEKLQHDRELLNSLTASPKQPKGPEAAVPQPASPDTPASPKAPVEAGMPASAPVPPAQPVVPQASAGSPAEPTAAAKPPASPVAAVPTEAPAKPASKELRATQEETRAREHDARQAQEKVQSLRDRIDVLRRNLDSEHRLLDSARKKAELAQQARTAATQDLQRKLTENPTEMEIFPLWVKVAEAEQRVDEAEALQQASSGRIQELQAGLAELQAEQLAALQEFEKKHQEVESARKRLSWLEHPLHPYNIGLWLLDHGPKLAAILLGMFVLHFLVRCSSSRLVRIMARNNQRGTEQERQNRAESLMGVFRHAVTVVIFVGGSLILLESVGIPIVPLLGGAAVVGLAVAFGAQNLIRDYFAGFMVLLEDQYSINDVVKINNISGLVEKISLRMTVLRDLSGVVHFVPHGTISSVSNMTHGWSRALFEIGVAYKEDVDRVMAVLIDLGKELRKDPVLGPVILEDPEMLGVDGFDDSAVKIKFFMKTKPLQQWAVKRELLRRIKHRFDELQIEIPFPHRTIYYRSEQDDSLATVEAEENQKAA